MIKQESIPVGCVPSVAVAAGGGGLHGGVCLGVSVQGDVCLRGVCQTPPCEQND